MGGFASGIYVQLQSSLLNRWRTGAGRERGATAVEYSLMVALIAGIVIGAVAALGISVNELFATPTIP